MVAKSSECESPSGDKQFKGVRRRSWGKWVSEIRLPNTRDRLWLGSYATAEQAARAFDVAVVCLRGKSAALNFPESPPAYAPIGLPHHQIQELAAAAAAAAYACHPSATGQPGLDKGMSSAGPGSIRGESSPGRSGESGIVTSEGRRGAGMSAIRGESEMELRCCDEASGDELWQSNWNWQPNDETEVVLKYDWAYEQLRGSSAFDCWSASCCAEQLFTVDQSENIDELLVASDMVDPHGLWSL